MTAFLGVQLVLLTGALALGCETGRLLGETCTRDDECATGVCRAAVCRPALRLGENPAQPIPPEDAAADVAPDVAPDVTPDVAPDVAPDAPEEAAAEAGPDAADSGTDANDGGDGGASDSG